MISMPTAPRSLGMTLGDMIGDPARIKRREVGAPSNEGANRMQARNVGLGNAAMLGLPVPANADPAAPLPAMPAAMRPAPAGPDYAAILAQAIGPAPHMSGWQRAASIIGPALMAATGNPAGANAMIEGFANRRNAFEDRQREAGLTAVKWHHDDDVARAKANQPDYFNSGEDRVRYDPSSGTATRIYDAPRDYQDYAAATGHAPGTDGYFQAVEDHVLRGNGPTAFKFDRDLQMVRDAATASRQAARSGDQAALERLRQAGRAATHGAPTYRDLHPAMPRSGAPRTAVMPTVSTPAEAASLAPGTKFKTPDGRVKVR